MENASKALLIAAGFLIGIIIVSMLVLGYNQISNYYQQQSDNISLNQIVELNKKFTNYDGRTIRGNEMLSVINLVVDYNTWVDNNASEGYNKIDLNISFEGIVAYSSTESKWSTFHIEEGTSYDYLIPRYVPINNETKMEKFSFRKNELLEEFNKLAQNNFIEESVVSESSLQLLSSNVHTIRDWINDTENNVNNTQYQQQKNVKTANLLDKILKTNFSSESTPDEVQRKMVSQKSNIKKVEKIAAEYYELTQFKRAYFKCEGNVQNSTGVVTGINGKVEKMSFKIVLNSDGTVKFN